MIVLAPGTEDPALSGCRLREATSTFPALAGAKYPIWPDGLTRGENTGGRTPGPLRKSALAGRLPRGLSRDQVGTKSALSRHQVEILRKCLADAEIADLMAIAERADRTKFRDQVLKPLLADNLLAMTIPDKPTSRNQRYRTTDKGRAVLATLPTEKTE